MKVKMKRCVNCKSLLSYSSKVCNKCGRKELEKGFYTDESNKSMIFNKHLNKSESHIINCPTCGAGVNIKYGLGECSVCDDEISTNGSSYYQEFIDRSFNDESE